MIIDESELLTQWAAGGKKGDTAFAVLYAKYNKKIRRDAKNLGRDPDDASQDVWLRLALDRNQGSLPTFGEFEAYLYRLTQKACQRDAVDAGVPTAAALHEVAIADLPSSPSTEDIVSASQLSDLTAAVVDSMPEHVRNAWAHKRRGDTDHFAATQLGVSERTYKNRVVMAREIIKEALQKRA